MGRTLTDAEISGDLARAIAVLLERLLEIVPKPKPPEPEERPNLSVKEIARLTTLSTKTIYRDARLGKLKSTRMGRRLIFARDDVDEWISSAPVKRYLDDGGAP